MLTNEQISAALVNPKFEEGKIIPNTTCNAFAVLKAAGCNSFSLEAHPKGGYFFFGFNASESDEVIDTHHLNPVIRCMVSKNWKGDVTATSQIGMLKVKNEAGVFEAVPCLVTGESKLETKQSGRL